MHKVVQEWNSKVQKNNRIQQLVIGFKQDTSHSIAKRLELAGLSYEYLKVQYESMSSQLLKTFLLDIFTTMIDFVTWPPFLCILITKVASDKASHSCEDTL